jgi:plastocyanin
MTHHIHPLRAAGAVAFAALALALAGCGSDDESGATTGATPTGGGGGTVAVTEAEFTIELASDPTAGENTFTVDNTGEFPHDLTISGPAVEDETTGTIEPGSTGELSTTLEDGTYRFYCSIGDHAAQGMDIEVTVGG